MDDDQIELNARLGSTTPDLNKDGKAAGGWKELILQDVECAGVSAIQPRWEPESEKAPGQQTHQRRLARVCLSGISQPFRSISRRTLLNCDVSVCGQNDLEHRRALLDLSFLPGRLWQSVDRVVYWRDECDIPKL
jgi:hypothetical protein